MHALLAYSYQMTGGASCRIHTDDCVYVSIRDQGEA